MARDSPKLAFFALKLLLDASKKVMDASRSLYTAFCSAFWAFPALLWAKKAFFGLFWPILAYFGPQNSAKSFLGGPHWAPYGSKIWKKKISPKIAAHSVERPFLTEIGQNWPKRWDHYRGASMTFFDASRSNFEAKNANFGLSWAISKHF